MGRDSKNGYILANVPNLSPSPAYVTLSTMDR